MTLLTLLLTSALAGDGWRDHNAVHAEATPPLQWQTPRWSTATDAWGNGSPVLFGSLVCATAEPTTLLCLSQQTGAAAWSATNDYVDTVPPAERASVSASLAKAGDLEEKMRTLQREVSSIRREVRRGEEGAAAKLEQISAELNQLKRTHDELAPLMTPPVLDTIGYASHTPLVHGSQIVHLTGNGVVSAFGTDGRRQWSRWLGPAPRPMEGYELGTASSPVWADGVIVVGHGTLVGLDPATGAVRWKAGGWRHYGTPAVVDVGGLTVIATPDGRILRGRDGAELAKGLASLWYVGPVTDGTTVYWAGGLGDASAADNTRFVAVQLSRAGDGVTATTVVSTRLPKQQRVYVSPLVHDGLVYVLDIDRVLYVLDGATGSPVYTQSLSSALQSIPYPSLTLAGSAIFAGDEAGDVVAFAPGRQYRELGRSHMSGGMRATPAFDGTRVFVRSLKSLSLYEAP